jgi:hypothetical protein
MSSANIVVCEVIRLFLCLPSPSGLCVGKGSPTDNDQEHGGPQCESDIRHVPQGLLPPAAD